MENIIATLAMGEPLPEKHKDHALTGNWIGHRECHILPDWLLIYRIENDVLVLTLARTGTQRFIWKMKNAALQHRIGCSPSSSV